MRTEGLLPIGYRFEEFRVDLERRILFRSEEPVALPTKAFEVLVCLVEQSGTVLEKETLLKLVWPDTFVEEANLTVHISTLRKVLGEVPGQHRFIVTVPKQGYRFVAHPTPVFPVEKCDSSLPPLSSRPATGSGGTRFWHVGLGLGLTFALAFAGFGLVRLGGKDQGEQSVSPATRKDSLPEVRIACEKGWYHFHRGLIDGPHRGLFFFRQALAQKPDSAPALTGLATACYRLSLNTGDEAEHTAFLKEARQAAIQACLLDTGNAEAHSIRAVLALQDEKDLLLAEREHLLALRLNPESALVHLHYGWFLFEQKDFGRAEAEAKKAVRLEPLSLFCQTSMVRMLVALGKYGEAEDQCRQVLDFEPNYPPARLLQGRILVEQRKYSEAIAVLEHIVDLNRVEGNILEAVSTLGIAYAAAGQMAQAQRALDFLADYPTIYSGFHRLLILQELGETETARQELVQLTKTGGPALVLACRSPRLSVFHANPQLHRFFQNQTGSNY